MIFTLDDLNALKPDGSPLVLRSEHRNNMECILSAEGRRTLRIQSARLLHEQDELLKKVFAHYPDPVTLNGDSLERQPLPDQAAVTIVQAKDLNREHTTSWNYSIGGETALDRHLNTFINGILCDLFQAHTPPRTYWARMAGQHPHWSPAAMVVVSPVYRPTEEELESLDPVDFRPHRYQGSIPDTLRDMRVRAESLMDKTLEGPDMPERWDQDPFHYVTGAPLYERSAKRLGAARCSPTAHRPFFRGRMTYSPDLVSVAQALYRTDADLVPVVTAQRDTRRVATHRKIEAFGFEVTPPSGDFDPGPGPLFIAGRIELHVKLDGQRTHLRVPAPFRMSGFDEDSMRVDFVPNLTDREDLKTHIIMAYREYDEYQDSDEAQDELERLSTKVDALLDNMGSVFWESAEQCQESWTDAVAEGMGTAFEESQQQ